MSTDRKYGAKSSRKRKFHGNRFTNKAKTDFVDDCLSTPGSSQGIMEEVEGDNPGRSTSVKQNATPTRSEMKLQDLYGIISDSESKNNSDSNGDESDESDGADVVLDELEGNRIIDVGILSAMISSQLVCGFCHAAVKLYEKKRQGLGSAFEFLCNNSSCSRQTTFPSCAMIEVGNLSVNSVNRCATLAMRCVGGSRTDLKIFCGIMDLPTPVGDSSFNLINQNMERAASAVQAKSMANAAKTEYKLAEENNECRNCDVSVDGTWMTRGHSSKVGVTTIIGCSTGKVLDTTTLSKVCKSCQYWEKKDKNSEHGTACWQVCA